MNALPDWAKPLYYESVDQSRYPIEWFEHQIASGRFRVWTVERGDERAVIVASIKVYPGKVKDVSGEWAAGDHRLIVELIPEALAWGKAKGCEQGLIESRPEWAAVLASQGWEAHQLTIRKDL